MKTLLLKFNIWSTFAVLATLNILDAASTAILVYQFGSEIEANPIVRHWIEAYGVTGIYMIKFVVVAFLGLTVAAVIRYRPLWQGRKIIHICMWILNAILAFIVMNNIILVVISINT